MQQQQRMVWVVFGAIVLAVSVTGMRRASAERGDGVRKRSKTSKATTRTKPKATPRKARLKKLSRVVTPTDNAIMDGFVRSVSRQVTGGKGRWSFKLNGHELMVITDERADRMRIMTPIVEVAKIGAAEMSAMLEANFDRALDAKYSIWQGVVWGVFTHPLTPLSKYEFRNAARQVAELARTFGTSYSSTNVVFGGGARKP